LEQKRVIREQKEAEVANIQAQIAHKQAFVDRFRAKASKATQAQSRIKQIEKLEIPELAQSSRQSPSFQFALKRPSGKEVLRVKGIAKSFGQKKVLNGVSFDVLRGERLSIIGPNGIGKSTLLKILLDELGQDGGTFDWGFEAQRGYFAQNHDMSLREKDQSMQDWLWQFCPEQGQGFVRSMLGRVLFSQDEVYKSLSILSGGELARLDLARIMLEKPNVLVLDEPTNHLDVETIDALIDALKAYEGTLLFVSHDRYFVSALATRILELKASGVNDFRGTFDEYLAACGDDHLDVGLAIRAKRLENQSQEAIKEDRKAAYQDSKRKSADEKKRLAELSRVTHAIEALEKRKAEIEAEFCVPGFFEKTDPSEVRKLQEEQASILAQSEELYRRWEMLEGGTADVV
jgi:ATPase subunit of ABC transporter with duplicated ATPase domains